MPLNILEFLDITDLHNGSAQVVEGQPIAASADDFVGTHVLDERTKIIKIAGNGTITWPNAVTETFNGTEFRGTRGLSQIVVSA